MFPHHYHSPIPPPPPDDWARVPPPEDRGEPLVDPTALSPRVSYAASYLNQGVDGGMAVCLLRERVAQKLVAAAESLPHGWSLLIFDALRPLRVQQALYDHFRTEYIQTHPDASEEEVARFLSDFVARPARNLLRPPPHTTGGAVDLTLCRDGVPLNMGTGFDDMTPLAYTRALEGDCPPGMEAARDNRRLLYHLLTAQGLVNYPCEWWHFAYGERQWAAIHNLTPFYGYREECDR